MHHHVTAFRAGRARVPSSPLAVSLPGARASDADADRGPVRLDDADRARVFNAGETLFEQGDEFAGLYRVVSGLVAIRIIDESGHLSLLSFARAGDVVGYCPLLLGGPHPTSAAVLQTARIVYVEPAASRTLVQETGDAMATLLRQSTRDLAALQQKHIRMLTQEAPARLANLLLLLCKDGGGRGEGDVCSFVLPLSRGDVADYIGIRAETLSRAIRHLRGLGVARINGREVHIPSLGRLRQFAAPETEAFACAV